MAQEMYKHDAMLHVVWSVATVDKTWDINTGKEKSVTPEEDDYLDAIRRHEEINMNWADFNAKRKSLNYDSNVIIDEACKAIRGCGKAWKIKSLGYMKNMAWTSPEDTLYDENYMSDKEWSLVLRAQRELGLSDEERKNSSTGLLKK